MRSMSYRPAPLLSQSGLDLFDPVAAADFPQTVLRYRNARAARGVGLDALSDADWINHFGCFAPLPDNQPQPLALRYHGHQFRHYNPDLGDGRGFLFAQMYDGDHRLLDLGTKGSGRTPYSRGGDGRLTLKGGVREVLATAMLEALGVPTSKSFSLIETGEALTRGDEPSPTRSSVLVRLSHSHIRFGTFERLAFLNDADTMRGLVAFIREHYYPDAENAAAVDADGARVLMLHEPGKLNFTLTGKERRLTLQFGFLPGAYSNGGQTPGGDFVVEVTRAGQPPREIFLRRLLPVTVPADRGLQTARVDLAGIAAGDVLSVRTAPVPGGNTSWGWTYLSRLVIE